MTSRTLQCPTITGIHKGFREKTFPLATAEAQVWGDLVLCPTLISVSVTTPKTFSFYVPDCLRRNSQDTGSVAVATDADCHLFDTQYTKVSVFQVACVLTER